MQIPALLQNESTLIREKWKLAGGEGGRGYGRLRVYGPSLAESLTRKSLSKLLFDLTQSLKRKMPILFVEIDKLDSKTHKDFKGPKIFK